MLVSLCLSIRPSVLMSVRVEQIGSHWTDFHGVLYLRISRQYVERIQVPLIPYNNNGRGELSYLVPLGSEKISAPYFKQCFFRGGGGITSQTESNTTPPSPMTEITNILFYILNLWLRISCSGLQECDTREKEIVI